MQRSGDMFIVRGEFPGEPPALEQTTGLVRDVPHQHKSRRFIKTFAEERRLKPTKAEISLAAVLHASDETFLHRFERERVCGNQWIVDFYFPEVRLAIEVDGPYHNGLKQTFLDAGLSDVSVSETKWKAIYQ